MVAALIRQSSDGRFLVQQRLAEKSRGGLWEFPGGKVEPGEADDAALKRECEEELGVEVDVSERLWSTVHPYPDFSVELVLYRARILAGEPQPLGAQRLRFCTPQEMTELAFCEADLPLVAALCERAL